MPATHTNKVGAEAKQSITEKIIVSQFKDNVSQ